MERGAWTAERLDDRFDQIDRRFDRLEAQVNDLRVETRTGFGELRGEMAELRSLIWRLHLTTMVGLLGLVAAVIVRGG